MENQGIRLQNNSKKGYINASSVLESVVAIAIIAICMLLAVRVYALVLNDTVSNSKTISKLEVDKLAADARANQDFEPNEYHLGLFKVQKKVSDFEGNPGLKHVSFIVQSKRDTVEYSFLMTNENHFE